MAQNRISEPEAPARVANEAAINGPFLSSTVNQENSILDEWRGMEDTTTPRLLSRNPGDLIPRRWGHKWKTQGGVKSATLDSTDAGTFAAVAALTILSRSEKFITNYLRNLSISKGSTTVFAVHAPQSNLQQLFDEIRRLPSTNVGCISECPSPRHDMSLSLLNIPSSVHHRIWHSSIPGRQKAQVGRWYSKEQINDEKRPFVPFMAPKWDDGTSNEPIPTLPPDLHDIQANVSSLFYFTDDMAEGLSAALDHRLPRISKARSAYKSFILLTCGSDGCYCFVNPFCHWSSIHLLSQGAFHSSGAFGVALCNHERPEIKVNLSNLFKIGEDYTITSASSNLIYTINEQPAADVLMKIVTSRTRPVETAEPEKVYLGVLDGQEIQRVLSVSAGSPSRGALLLDAETAPRVGQTVAFLTSVQSPSLVPSTLDSSSIQIEAMCLSPEESQTQLPAEEMAQDVVLQNRFQIATDNGFAVDSGHGLWHCKIPGTTASFKLGITTEQKTTASER
ncbi:SubName: Full=Uncharacterized protein {ECO:0000313/EMBL:CCA76160.1} [Serendipita indica DSM 11827]|nr:SubName: Full=Uncharacterized protein {ECO:0000313/EMBL:CCA76160.1} [Serendipita indica DSM 11827]